ncbi:hypothetical protein HG536_0E02910 [Torulaspora globosa]|uniref:Uncharacterized protein n=1 Tax=Torulaspora globosa TaxID=48254 RepID=A0A7G3ZIP4_9SACH|nr:uncharacterized protein HG536_0E02910 [Torulaspora globosa]QLL33380.1 hypothetical protein HG536_0E02910 [Torulaspora globosa]
MKRRTAETVARTPKKQRIAENGSSPVIYHQLLDPTIAKFINMENLISPSKRSRSLKQKDGNKSIYDSVLLENAYRMFGISSFPVVDPSDLKLNEETKEIQITREMIGIRLEVFNESLSKYEKPYYVLLKKKMKSDSWTLFKHTVPQYIDVRALFNNTNGGIITSHNSIYLFARDLYKQLVALSMRVQYLEELANSKLVDDLDIDLEAAAVSFTRNGALFKLLLRGDEVVSCSIRSNFIEASLRPRHEALFLGPINELALKLKHMDQQ